MIALFSKRHEKSSIARAADNNIKIRMTGEEGKRQFSGIPSSNKDLLATPEVAGHAMKATDRELWPGAVIGKAMSKLENGDGLVLVSLQ